jgi:hypothetical protein
MLELQNFFKMKDFFAENFGNFWNFAKDFGNFCFRKNNVDPPPRRQHFPENFLGGPGMEGGPNFGIHPPTGNRLARPWLSLDYLSSGVLGTIFLGGASELSTNMRPYNVTLDKRGHEPSAAGARCS